MITKLIWDRSSQDKTAGYSEQGNWQILRATGIADEPERQLMGTCIGIAAVRRRHQRWLPTRSRHSAAGARKSEQAETRHWHMSDRQGSKL